jgi:proteic killer suppression protein
MNLTDIQPRFNRGECKPLREIKLRSKVPHKTLTLLIINALRYYSHVIVSFSCEDTQALALGISCRKFEQIETIARRKIRQLEIVEKLNDLRIPPGNRLEKLKGTYDGYFSIRINDQWRIIFRWTNSGPAQVKIIDYH